MSSGSVELKSSAEIQTMREAGRIVAEILDELETVVAPGMTTLELDKLAESLIAKKGAKPAFKGYRNFPACICISVNQEVVHGIPKAKRKISEGDLLKLDFGVVYDGYYGDSARTLAVGKVSNQARQLIDTTRNCLEKAIEVAVAGNRLGDIGHAVEKCARAAGFAPVRAYFGHGIGRKLHEPPNVYNFGEQGKGLELRSGMVLAIEPMINVGTDEVDELDDGWTVVTADAKLSAHFEHTIVIGKGPAEVLTRTRRSN